MYAVIREMREQIVETMQERGIKELAMCMSYQEWGMEQNYKPEDYEEDETDDYDYTDYLDQEAPYVIFFDKYCHGYDYRVDKVRLKTYKDSDPVLMFDCHESELGDDTFGENDLVFLTLYNVYDTLLDRLGIEDEPEKVYVFTAEQAWEGEAADIIVKTFRTREAAREFMHKFIHEDGDESIEDYVKRKGWEVEMDEPDLYRAYDDGRYSTDHIETTITESNIE